jgi:poly(A) polymerase
MKISTEIKGGELTSQNSSTSELLPTVLKISTNFLPQYPQINLPVQEEYTKQKPIRIPRPEHTLSRRHISQSALTVLYQLRHAGYQAFLVGGGVRDVLLGRVPKDFDVVTNALPEEIKKLFRSCRLIGRRFLLAHVRLNKDIVEVATFRAHHDKGGDGVMEDGRILRDNVYGTIDEDAWRRDFTINALYYDISDFSLLDYANGMADLQAGIIRVIGNPQRRYEEDPVRMLRAVRFAAKLGFTIAPDTATPIQQLSALLANIPPARLLEEVQKLFLSGYAVQAFIQLREYNLFRQLFPYTDECLDDAITMALMKQVFHNTDERLKNDKPVAPAFLLATLLWPPLARSLPTPSAGKNTHSTEILLRASQSLLAKQHKRVAIPKRIVVLMQEIWLLQLRLIRPIRGKRYLNLLEHPRFRASYDFLLLRAQAGEEEVKPFVQWWTQFINSDDQQRQLLLSQYPVTASKYPRRRRSNKKKVKIKIEIEKE